jgi:hypothetical protein
MRIDGSVGWGLLTVYIAGYDIIAAKNGHETLSNAFYRSMHHPIARWGTITAWSVVTAHLFNILPDKYDLIHLLGERISNDRSK